MRWGAKGLRENVDVRVEVLIRTGRSRYKSEGDEFETVKVEIDTVEWSRGVIRYVESRSEEHVMRRAMAQISASSLRLRPRKSRRRCCRGPPDHLDAT